ncbi:MAG TPA: sulfite exporter TauE/SafE family protein [Xanthobacteraceae bacterium]|nr:sulfite exporter TauE/SafE family protein [Xanthobacteraceae bacterium]
MSTVSELVGRVAALLRRIRARRASDGRILRPFARAGATRPASVVVAVVGASLLLAQGTLWWMHGTPGAALAMIAVFVAATIGSIAGFAFSALCGALLFHLMDSPVQVVQVLIVCSIAMQLLSVASLWRSIDWRSLPVFLMGGAFGVPVGAYLLLHLAAGTYRDVIGTLLIAYGSYLLVRGPARPVRLGPLVDAGAGFLGGITGGLVGFPSVFVTISCTLKGWDKARQRGVYQPFILCMQPAVLVAISLMRPPSLPATQLDWQALAFVPAALLGTWLGLRIFKRLGDRQFQLAVNALLIASGVGLFL